MQAVVSGLMSGALYALLAVGLIVAWQTSRVVNLAHGESYAWGGLAAAGLAQAGFGAWSLAGGVLAAAAVAP